jgi:hypothetical protein
VEVLAVAGLSVAVAGHDGAGHGGIEEALLHLGGGVVACSRGGGGAWPGGGPRRGGGGGGPYRGGAGLEVATVEGSRRRGWRTMPDRERVWGEIGVGAIDPYGFGPGAGARGGISGRGQPCPYAKLVFSFTTGHG